MVKEAITTAGRFAFGIGAGIGMGFCAWALGVSMSAKACTQATEEEREQLKHECDRIDRIIREIGEA